MRRIRLANRAESREVRTTHNNNIRIMGSTTCLSCSLLPNPKSSTSTQFNSTCSPRKILVVKSSSRKNEEEAPATTTTTRHNQHSKLGIGSPIVVVEAPNTVKTAASVPCLRLNSGLVNPGDVGRIVSRKPKDVWAVRLGIGTYLIDAKYFRPLELDP